MTPHIVEGQDDGSVLCWFNAYAEAPLGDELELCIGGETICDGVALPLDSLSFKLKSVEPEYRLRLIPEQAEIEGMARILSATINQSKVRGYFTIEWESMFDDPHDFVSFRLLDADGKPLSDGMGWMSSGVGGVSTFTEQCEFQALDAIPDAITLEMVDKNGNAVGRCVCRVVEVD